MSFLLRSRWACCLLEISAEHTMATILTYAALFCAFRDSRLTGSVVCCSVLRPRPSGIDLGVVWGDGEADTEEENVLGDEAAESVDSGIKRR